MSNIGTSLRLGRYYRPNPTRRNGRGEDRASTEKAFTANTAYYRERRRYRSKVTASAVERNYKINGLGAECAQGWRLSRHMNYF
jgi:hypothetical protein